MGKGELIIYPKISRKSLILPHPGNENTLDVFLKTKMNFVKTQGTDIKSYNKILLFKTEAATLSKPRSWSKGEKFKPS